MKMHLFLLAVVIVLNGRAGLHAQNGCLPGLTTFSTQAQIDSFPINYPGCTQITGNLLIAEETDGGIFNLDSLIYLTSILGLLKIDGHATLGSLSGLDSLTSIGGGLIVSFNDALTDLSGLDKVTFVGAILFVFDNSSLESLNGLNNVTSVGDYVNVEKNASLTSLSGLDNLKSIGGGLYIRSNNSLTSLNGIGNLATIDGSLLIENNDALADLNGIDSLIAINGRLSLLGNPELTSLDGLANLDYTTIDSLGIYFNSTLSTCEIQPVCDHLENGQPALIGFNAPGCSTQAEVEAACKAISVDDVEIDEAIQVFPNPTKGIIQITTPDNTEWKVSAHDAMGRIVIPVHPLENGEIDLSAVPAGFYFLELKDGQRSITKRIIRQ